jgi:FkbM family methyltransferase
MKRLLRSALQSINLDINGFNIKFHPVARKLHLLRNLNLDAFLDIGANQGQFGAWLRSNGWRGKIHSFEPGSKACAALRLRAARDSNWAVHQLALGSTSGKLELHVSKDSFSSSLKAPTFTNLVAHPSVATDFSEVVQVKTLDAIRAEVFPEAMDFALKIDVQGHESEVLAGAVDSLRHCRLLIVELSLRELYQGQKLLHEVLPAIYGHGFYLTVIEPCHEDTSRLETLQVDAWFLQKASLPSAS